MKILLGICGSISAYKSYELLRSYIKAEHEVIVVLTSGANHFVNPMIFRALGAQKVYSFEDDFQPTVQDDFEILHIDLMKWCDRIVVAPLSANTLNKLAAGICDDLLGSILLASKKCTILFPAMNTQMLNNPITQNNMRKLQELPWFFLHPTASGELACKDIGEGKLPDVGTIFHSSLLINVKPNGSRVLINTGATVAYLDSVRYLTAPASGKTGIELAKVFLKAGYAVDLVAGAGVDIDDLRTIPQLNLVSVKTNEQMLKACEQYFDQCKIYISSAAISDIKFEQQKSKLKKSQFPHALSINKDTDIFKSLSQRRSQQVMVGFAAETELDLDRLQAKMENKQMDILVGNRVSNGASEMPLGFGSNENKYIILKRNGAHQELMLTKTQLAQTIYELTHD